MADAAPNLIVGLGTTGLSCARHLHRQGDRFTVTDSRAEPPGLTALQAEMPEVRLELGGFNLQSFLAATRLLVSPGVPLETPEILAARRTGVMITGDVDQFSRLASAPIVAITGSNGKSTVTSLVAAILRQAGLKVGLGGNLDGDAARPALDLLTDPVPDVYVLEVSSFQLETTERLGAAAAVILNLSEDHMDRYESLASYLTAKQKIFVGAGAVVFNRDDAATRPPKDLGVPVYSFGLDAPASHQEFGLVRQGAETYLACGGQWFANVSEVRLVGSHNLANALAAAALARAMGVDLRQIGAAITAFTGLPNRCQWVRELAGVSYYNDSKGTNVGATVAAIRGLGETRAGRVVLIAGGVGKGADFTPLGPVLTEHGRAVVLLGRDAPQIEAALPGALPRRHARDMADAVDQARSLAQPGDVVLLSPACASFDMFQNFQHRGAVFSEAVEALT